MSFANIFRLPRERKCCTSLEAKEDGDKRYLGNEIDLRRDDYDVCLDKMHHEKLLFYISFCFCFCFWVRSRFCFMFLVMGFVFPFRRFVFLFRVLGFRFCLLFRVLDFHFRVLNVCFVLRASRETFSFLHFMILVYIVIMVFILCFRFGICVSVLGFGFHFWVLWSAFSLSATIYI